ncbi:MAG: hypothetical protein UHU21_07410 [Lachnospiraceae bacterium]|nr:hypothetical protein [Lachnospiraceae bacterium]
MTRLIDADALNKKLCETTTFIKDGEEFQRMINDAPTIKLDGDTISRQAAILAITGEPPEAHYPSWYAERIKSLPSAPSAEAEQVTGKLNNPDDSLLTADSEACKEQKSKLDLISRQDAISAVWNHVTRDATTEELEQLPSAPDNRQRGEWVWKKDAMDWGIGAWVCNKCGCRPNTLWSTKRDSIPLAYAGSRFCGYCGAYMGGQNDD